MPETKVWTYTTRTGHTVDAQKLEKAADRLIQAGQPEVAEYLREIAADASIPHIRRSINEQ